MAVCREGDAPTNYFAVLSGSLEVKSHGNKVRNECKKQGRSYAPCLGQVEVVRMLPGYVKVESVRTLPV